MATHEEVVDAIVEYLQSEIPETDKYEITKILASHYPSDAAVKELVELLRKARDSIEEWNKVVGVQTDVDRYDGWDANDSILVDEIDAALKPFEEVKP